MPFLVPSGVLAGPWTECLACGARRNEHGPRGECPEQENPWRDDGGEG